jgi:hypothetical protein
VRINHVQGFHAAMLETPARPVLASLCVDHDDFSIVVDAANRSPWRSPQACADGVRQSTPARASICWETASTRPHRYSREFPEGAVLTWQPRTPQGDSRTPSMLKSSSGTRE